MRWINHGAEVLPLHRHRFISGTWAWEIPGDRVEDGQSLDRSAKTRGRDRVGKREWIAMVAFAQLTLLRGC